MKHTRTSPHLFFLNLVWMCTYTSAEYILREYANNHSIFIGAAANYNYLMEGGSNYTNILGTQYSIVTPENAMKWAATEPSRDQFNFEQGDYIVSFAKQNQQQVRGHNLCWGVWNPDWLANGNFSAQELEQILQNHISTVVSHYEGQLYSWDVVNEAVSDSPNQTDYLKQNIWYPAIPNYVDLAFQWARQSDPSVKLFYNDYSAEGMTPKSDAVYNMLSSMKSRGIPIDGIGLQYHVSLGYSPAAEDVMANIERLSALGLEVHITELDISFEGGAGDEDDMLHAQAELYNSIMKICLSYPMSCKSFETWGFTDLYTWLVCF
eukprot:TRINITY_DN7837_c0_g1_i1.p1 TRINITY_DN7837_c0_g1~~TRINITY_DN7837_c0_g1_i1.p1  ORF type:complete len:321 (-),score=56.64 TRINITY_DN7837_c0_g1_i1:166-1128(-)